MQRNWSCLGRGKEVLFKKSKLLEGKKVIEDLELLWDKVEVCMVLCVVVGVLQSANMSGARDQGQCWGKGTSGPSIGVGQQA